MDSNEERKIKQNILKTEILDEGYDVNNFMDFMDSRKKNGILQLIKVFNKSKVPTLITGT